MKCASAETGRQSNGHGSRLPPAAGSSPAMVTKVWKFVLLFGIRLVLRPRPVERRKLHAGGIHGNDFRELVERDLEPARIVDLRHQADVGKRDGIAVEISPRTDEGLERLEAFEDPVMVPGVDGALLLAH